MGLFCTALVLRISGYEPVFLIFAYILKKNNVMLDKKHMLV